MKIGLIVHSKTGNTLSVAEVLQKKLAAKGHSVTIERIVPNNEEEIETKLISLVSAPDPSVYDTLVFCASVRAFSLSPAMKVFLRTMRPLDNIKAAWLLTQFFPFAWMGGNNARRKLLKSAGAKGAEMMDGGIVHWGSKKRETQIAEMTDKIASLF